MSASSRLLRASSSSRAKAVSRWRSSFVADVGANALFRVTNQWKSGFKMIIDLAFASDGSLYVLQYASSPSLPGGSGTLVKVAADGTKTTVDTGATLQQPAGFTIGRDGSLYVSNKTLTPGGGEVLRIIP